MQSLLRSRDAVRRLCFLAAVTITGPAALAQSPPAYRAEYLGPAVNASAMNATGAFVGTTTLGTSERAWVASSGSPLAALPLPAGMLSSSAADINELGVIVGAVSPFYSTQFSPQAAAWFPDGGGGYAAQTLGMLPGHDRSLATAVNNVGDIVGTSVKGLFGSPVLFTAPGGIQDLSAVGDFVPSAINDARVLIGGSPTCKKIDLDTMVVEDLGVPQGLPSSYLSAQGYEINASGQVCGFAGLATGGNCTWEAARYTDGTGWEVFSACGQSNAAYDLNDLGDLVMKLNTAPYVYFQGIGTYRIEDLVLDEVGHWYVTNGYGITINNARQIVVPADNSVTGEGGLILLTAVPAGPVATASPYGSGINPAGSFQVASGGPVLGTTMTFGVDNPLGTQVVGSTYAFVLLSIVPDPHYPAGTLLTQFGMNPDGTGELLIQLGAVVRPILLGQTWAGPGNPAAVSLFVPDVPGLAGFHVYAQGVLFDPAPGSVHPVGLADALDLTLGF